MVDKKDFQFRITMKTLLGEGNPVWQDNQEFIRCYNEIQDISLVSPFRCFFLYQFANHANSLKGSFAQVGVYKGGSAKLISFVKDKEKKFYLFDTFEGLPQHDSKIDTYEKGKFGDGSEEFVKNLFKNCQNIKIVKGLFPETSNQIPKDEKFSFVYVDVDLYKSNYDSINFFYDKLVPGGVMIFDDYGFVNCKGIERSIKDFLKSKNAKEQPIITTKYQCILIKS